MIRNFRKSGILLLLSLFILVSQADAQDQKEKPEHLSGFAVGSLTYKFSDKWMAYLELQGRSIERFKTPDYYEIKGGTGYNINDNNQAFVGIGRYATYKEKSLSQEELRLWLQYTYSHYLFSRVDIDHRGRAEQRFFHYPKTGEKENTQRYRYRLSATVPINKPKVTSKTFFASAFNEVFLGPKDEAFKRNRLYSGVGYQFTRKVGLTTGYMWQRELASTGNRSLHFLHMQLNVVIDRKDDDEKRIFIPMAD